MVGIACPLCGGKGLEIVWGLHVDLDALERNPDVVLGGCCIQFGVSHECAECQHRWGIGEIHHYQHLGWLSRCGVDVDHLMDELDARFIPTEPDELVVCPDQRTPLAGEQLVLGTPGLVVLSEGDHETLEVAEYGTVTASPGLYVPVRVRPVRLFTDDNRGPVQRADHLAKVIKDASRRRRATFRPCVWCDRKVPPEWHLDDGRCIHCAPSTEPDSADPATGTPASEHRPTPLSCSPQQDAVLRAGMDFPDDHIAASPGSGVELIGIRGDPCSGGGTVVRSAE